MGKLTESDVYNTWNKCDLECLFIRASEKPLPLAYKTLL